MGWLSKVLGGGSHAPALLQGEPDFVVVDVETSCSRYSSICQIGVVGFTAGRESFAYESFINPEDDFDAGNVRVHGIEAHHVRRAPRFGDLHPTLCRHLEGRVVVAHSGFDRAALKAACERHERPAIDARWLDSVSVARRAWPDLGSHKLDLLADHLGLDLEHHNALSDARAAGMVVVRAMDVLGVGLDDLFQVRTSPVRKASGSLKREGASCGPMSGACIVMTGEFERPKSDLADKIANAGGSVTGSVTRKTTHLVLGVQDPSTFAGKSRSAKHLRALELIEGGQPIAIIDEAALMQMLA